MILFCPVGRGRPAVRACSTPPPSRIAHEDVLQCAVCAVAGRSPGGVFDQELVAPPGRSTGDEWEEARGPSNPDAVAAPACTSVGARSMFCTRCPSVREELSIIRSHRRMNGTRMLSSYGTPSPEPAVLSPQEAVVGGVHDDRIVEPASVGERLQERADRVIHGPERFELPLSNAVDPCLFIGRTGGAAPACRRACRACRVRRSWAAATARSRPGCRHRVVPG